MRDFFYSETFFRYKKMGGKCACPNDRLQDIGRMTLFAKKDGGN